MTFLNPLFFWGLLLILVPIVIHLFNFRRFKKVLFSNLTFLVEVKNKKKSSSQLKKILVLISRICAVIFLILAFTQPVFLNDLDNRIGKHTLYYLDNSQSMQQVDDSGEPLLFHAYNRLEDLVKRPDGESIRVMNNDQVIDRNVSENIEVLNVFSSKSTELDELIDKANLYSVDEVVLLSDFQKNAFNLQAVVNDSSRVYRLLQITAKEQTNLFVDTVYLTSYNEFGENLVLTVNLKNVGKEDLSDVLLKMSLGKRQIVSKTFNISSNSEKRLTIDLAGIKNVFGNYIIELSDVPVVFDNEFHFCLNKPPKTKVLVLRSGTSQSEQFFNKVYANEDLFDLHIDNIEEISLSTIEQTDLLIIEGIDLIPGWLSSQRDRLNCRILIVPGEQFDVESYSRMLGIRLERIVSNEQQVLSDEALDHPLLKDILSVDRKTQLSLPRFAPILNAKGYYETIMKTNNRDPVILRTGSEVYVLTVPLSDSFTDFHKHALFVPIMYKLAQPNLDEPLFHRLDEEYLNIPVDSLVKESVLKISSATESFIPSYRYEARGIVMEVPDDLVSPGIFTVTNGMDTLGVYAFNHDAKESDISSYSAEEIESYIGLYDHVSYYPISQRILANASTDLESDFHSLWKYALVLALIFVLVETILLRFLK